MRELGGRIRSVFCVFSAREHGLFLSVEPVLQLADSVAREHLVDSVHLTEDNRHLVT